MTKTLEELYNEYKSDPFVRAVKVDNAITLIDSKQYKSITKLNASGKESDIIATMYAELKGISICKPVSFAEIKVGDSFRFENHPYTKIDEHNATLNAEYYFSSSIMVTPL